MGEFKMFQYQFNDFTQMYHENWIHEREERLDRVDLEAKN